jgi:hypothetical protein
MAQLAEQHQRQLHRDHERDEPSKRSRDMTRQATSAARETRCVQAQRTGRREQHRPPERHERDHHEGVRPGPREVRELGDRRQRDQRWTSHDQQRQQHREQNLQREQARREQHSDDHQERSEHAARTRQQRAPEQDTDDPRKTVRDGREPQDRVGKSVRPGDYLRNDPAVSDEHSCGARTAPDRTRRMRRASEAQHPVAHRSDRERHRQQRRPEVNHVALQFPDVRPGRGVGQRDEMLDRGYRAVLEKTRDQRTGKRAEKPFGDPFDDAVKRRETEKPEGHDRALCASRTGRRRERERASEHARRHGRQRPCGAAHHHRPLRDDPAD